MAVNGNICIYRLTSSGGSNDQETDVTDKVEFDTSATNGASTVPDAKSHVDTYSSTMTLVTQENPVPDSNKNAVPSTSCAILSVPVEPSVM